jgi:hypothetical protein
MKYAVPFVLAALLLGACTRTVIERPQVVEKETVVERPVVAATPLASPARSCAYAGTSYSHGSSSCQSGYEYRCSDGAWSSSSARC